MPRTIQIQPNQDITPLLMAPARSTPPSMKEFAIEEARTIGDLLAAEAETELWDGEITKTEALQRLHRLASAYGAEVLSAAGRA